MFKDLLETLKILKPSAPVREKVTMEKRSSELDLLERVNKYTSEGKLPDNAAKEDISTIIKKLTEMAVKEQGEGGAPTPKEGKIYFGSSGQNIYYADLVKDEASKQIQSLKIYDVTDSEVKSYEDLAEIPNAEVLYNAVNDLNLDSVSYQMLMDLDLLKKPEEEKPEEEPKAEEKPEEPPKEEKPEEIPPEEEEEIEEPIGDSVQVGETIVFKKSVEGLAIKEGMKAKIKSFDVKEAIAVIEFDLEGKLTESKITLVAMKEGTVRWKKVKKVKEAALDIKQDPKKEGEVKTDVVTPPADPKVATDVKTTDAPVKQGDSSINKDTGPTDADPNLNKDKTKKEGDIKLADEDPDKVKQGAPVTVPKVEGAKVISDAADPALDAASKVGDAAKLDDKDPAKVKQNTGAVDAGQKNLDKGDVKPDATTVVGNTDKIEDSKLDVQEPEVYKKELDALQQKLEKKEITQADFDSGKLDLDKKYKAQPAGTTEAKVPDNAAAPADDKMIKTLLEKHGLTAK